MSWALMSSTMCSKPSELIELTSAINAAIWSHAHIDFFDNGSFWLLEAPRHTGHHICALGRTTEKSWILLGGDACHNTAQLRPILLDHCRIAYLPVYSAGHHRQNDAVAPIYLVSFSTTKRGRSTALAPGMYEDFKKAQETLERLKAFDGRHDIMIVIAHDMTLLNVIDFVPRNINDWKRKDWADRTRWLYLRELEKLVVPLS